MRSKEKCPIPLLLYKFEWRQAIMYERVSLLSTDWNSLKSLLKRGTLSPLVAVAMAFGCNFSGGVLIAKNIYVDSFK